MSHRTSSHSPAHTGGRQLRPRLRSNISSQSPLLPPGSEPGGAVQNSTLQAGKVSSCMATVLLLPNTVIINSPRRLWASWYQSCIGSESNVGIRVTCRRSSDRSQSKQVISSTIIYVVGTDLDLRPTGLPFQQSVQDAPHGPWLHLIVSTDDVV